MLLHKHHTFALSADSAQLLYCLVHAARVQLPRKVVMMTPARRQQYVCQSSEQPRDGILSCGGGVWLIILLSDGCSCQGNLLEPTYCSKTLNCQGFKAIYDQAEAWQLRLAVPRFESARLSQYT